MSPPRFPEYDLLRGIARAELSDDQVESFRDQAGSVDWETVLRLTGYHRLVPLLYVHVRDHGSDVVPDGVQALLRRSAMESSIEVLFLSSEMATIANRLREDDIPFLVLKGPSLAEAFGDVSRRPFVDNDLLIRREDFTRLEHALLDIGFNQHQLSPNQKKGHLFVFGEYTFGRAVGTQISTTDVHVNLVPIGYPYQTPFEVLRGRSRSLEIAGTDVPVLSWEDLFIALCVNALKDQWNRLRLASDLAEVGKFVDWPLVWDRARKGRCRRAVALAVLVTAEELQTEFPEDVIREAQSDTRVQHLTEHVREHLRTFHKAPVLEGTERARLNLLAQDDIRAQVRYSGYVALRRLAERFVS